MTTGNPMRRHLLLLAAVSLLAPPHAPGQDPGAVLPADPAVTMKQLPNGLTYYIRTNRKPEKRAELRLVINAGSVLESEDQRGLAHLLEHMAFNGTKNFPKQELVNYLESIGMRFGPDLNAYTSFDETVYMLQIPTDKPEIVDRAFDILEEWAHNIALDGAEIDKERGVVIEEWRLGRGANARMLDKQFPILFRDSRYAERLPIGKKEVLESFPHEAIRKFYREWYRPDLMAVVAVGDFDPAVIEGAILKHFTPLANPAGAPERPVFPVPSHTEPLAVSVTDPEAPVSAVNLVIKHPVTDPTTAGAYRKQLVENLAFSMLNNRLTELTKEADPPFVMAFAGSGSFVRNADAFSLGAVARDGSIPRAFSTVLTETERAKAFGFTATELEREKSSMLRRMERLYNEREKTESSSFAEEYIRNFLEREPFPGIAAEYEIYKKQLPGITLAEVNAVLPSLLTPANRVVMANAPEKTPPIIPAEAELLAMLAAPRTVSPYDDRVSTEPLVPVPPKPGSVTRRKQVPELGVTEWTLSNGVKVVLKPTAFKNDEVLMTASSPGGSSVMSDAEYESASAATQIMQESGLGSFDQVALRKKLTGKIASVTPYISDLEEGLNGSAAPADLETMFQLVYLTFTAPRDDSTAFVSWRSRMITSLANRELRPESAYEDTILVTMAQHHPRRRPWDVAALNAVDRKSAMGVYRDRFADAGDFTFVFVGAFTPEKLEPLVRQYIASLPSRGRKETWQDRGIRAPGGAIRKEVRRGIEPKSSTRTIYTGDFEWSTQNRYELSSLASVLRIKLRESLREEKGGTYGVGASGSPIGRPKPEYRFVISFGCSPDRVDELLGVADAVVDSVRNVGVGPEYVAKVQEIQRREREVDMQTNRFWLGNLSFLYSYGEDPKQILTYTRMVDGLSAGAVRAAANRYLNPERKARFILYPAEQTGK
jgi:zinc protease